MSPQFLHCCHTSSKRPDNAASLYKWKCLQPLQPLEAPGLGVWAASWQRPTSHGQSLWESAEKSTQVPGGVCVCED